MVYVFVYLMDDGDGLRIMKPHIGGCDEGVLVLVCVCVIEIDPYLHQNEERAM
jgi:hypothetical protein